MNTFENKRMHFLQNNTNLTDAYYSYANKELNRFIEEEISNSVSLKFSIDVKLACSLVVIFLGLIGHFLTILVYSKKINRTNSSHVYMLCLSLIDSIYLIVHIFEDTIPSIYGTYQAFLEPIWLSNLLKHLNVIHKNDLGCRFISFLRNMLRLVSAFLILVFTIQRFLVVHFPLKSSFKSNKSAWSTFKVIFWIGLLSNFWTLYIFELQSKDEKFLCDVKKDWYMGYFLINLVYTILIIFLPTLLIFVFNILIVIRTIKEDAKRKKTTKTELENPDITAKKSRSTSTFSEQTKKRRFGIQNETQIHLNVAQKIDVKAKKFKYSIRTTRTLMLISCSFAILNVPYLIAWFKLFNAMVQNQVDTSTKHEIFSNLQITELFNLVNYASNFFLYCISGSDFRRKLKNFILRK